MGKRKKSCPRKVLDLGDDIQQIHSIYNEGPKKNTNSQKELGTSRSNMCCELSSNIIKKISRVARKRFAESKEIRNKIQYSKGKMVKRLNQSMIGKSHVLKNLFIKRIRLHQCINRLVIGKIKYPIYQPTSKPKKRKISSKKLLLKKASIYKNV